MATKWKLDPSHSEVEFKVKHLMITTITGRFDNYDLEVITNDDDFTTTTAIEFTAAVDSISTNNAQRDEHLKSVEFFDTETFPSINFSGDEFKKNSGNLSLHGILTIKGISLPIELQVDFGGVITDPYGQHKAGFTVTGQVSRKAFGLVWNPMTEAGQVVVGDQIKISCNIQLIKV